MRLKLERNFVTLFLRRICIPKVGDVKRLDEGK